MPITLSKAAETGLPWSLSGKKNIVTSPADRLWAVHQPIYEAHCTCGHPCPEPRLGSWVRWQLEAKTAFEAERRWFPRNWLDRPTTGGTTIRAITWAGAASAAWTRAATAEARGYGESRRVALRQTSARKAGLRHESICSCAGLRRCPRVPSRYWSALPVHAEDFPRSL